MSNGRKIYSANLVARLGLSLAAAVVALNGCVDADMAWQETSTNAATKDSSATSTPTEAITEGSSTVTVSPEPSASPSASASEVVDAVTSPLSISSPVPAVITGVSGNATNGAVLDLISDDWLIDDFWPNFSLTPSVGAHHYIATIYQGSVYQAGIGVVCAPQVIAPFVTSFGWPSADCSLSTTGSYVAEIKTYDVAGNESISAFNFTSSTRAVVTYTVSASTLSVSVGQTATSTVTLTNTGQFSAKTITLGAFSSATVAQTSTNCLAAGASSFELAPNASCQFTLSYTPVTAGDNFAANRSVTYNNGLYTAGQTNATVAPSAVNCISSAPSIPTVLVVPVYYTNAANWNSYVAVSNSSAGPYGQTDNAGACVAADVTTGHRGCVHGGELKKVVVSSETSCVGLAIAESLGAFDWECKVSSAIPIFYSYRLKPTKRLRDLLTDEGTGWKLNQVTITKNDVVAYRSVLDSWWTNPVEALPTSPSGQLILSSPNKIYTVIVDTTTRGISWSVPGVAIVVYSGKTLTRANIDVAGNCTVNSLASSCLLNLSGADYTWVEGAFSGNPTGANTPAIYNAIHLAASRFVTIRDVTISSALNSGIWLESDSHANRLERVKISGFEGTAGLMIKGATQSNWMYNLQVAGSSGSANGIEFSGSSKQELLDSRIYSIHKGGLVISNLSRNNIVKGVISANNGMNSVGLGVGVEVGASSSNILSHLTLANNNLSGLRVSSGSDLTHISQILGLNNSASLEVDNSSGLRLSELALATSGIASVKIVYLLNSNNNVFSGLLNNLASAPCAAGGTSVSPGIGASCNPTDLSTFYYVNSPTSWSQQVIEKIVNLTTPSNSDAANLSDANGLSGVGTHDWFSFDNAYRTWGLKGSASGMRADSLAERCSNTASNCAIWDYRLKAGGVGAYNVHSAFVAGNACPTLVSATAPGYLSMAANNPTPQRDYLINAQEIIGDNIGNDNGLCESGEACMYSANIGAYQGEGSIVGPCTFTDVLNPSTSAAAVTGVTLYGWSTLGFTPPSPSPP